MTIVAICYNYYYYHCYHYFKNVLPFSNDYCVTACTESENQSGETYKT